ncbi:hypothetical protein BH23VER1_BH23VER1_30870 [soil metagenome]
MGWMWGGFGTASALELPEGFSWQVESRGWSGIVAVEFVEDGRAFVLERAGRVWEVGADGARRPAPAIDITDEVGYWRDHGAMDFALDPDFLKNGFVYLFYVVDRHHLFEFGTPSYSKGIDHYFAATIGRITRYKLESPGGVSALVPGSRTILLGESKETGIPITYGSHGLGSLVFGTDGSLLASTGDGATSLGVDIGHFEGTYSDQAEADGIMEPDENIGALRSQSLGSLCGKILRLDPTSGNGILSNPFYDADAPRSPASRIWSLGLRNPFRMSLVPGWGSEVPAAGDPGRLVVGDVGWVRYDEVHVVTGARQNFGWPLYEGFELTLNYALKQLDNQDAPNPLYGQDGCNNKYFGYLDLIAPWNTPHDYVFPNPCDQAQPVPSGIPTFRHEAPVLTIAHPDPPDRRSEGRTPGEGGGTYSRIGEPGTPIIGEPFSGSCVIGGFVVDGLGFPDGLQHKYLFADYVEGWIKVLTLDAQGNVERVEPFASRAGAISFLEPDPRGGFVYGMVHNDEFRKVTYAGTLERAPSASARATVEPGGTANVAPVVSAGRDRVAAGAGAPFVAGLRGAVADATVPLGGSVSSEWKMVSGPGAVSFADAGDPMTEATFSAAGEYVLELTGSDTQFTARDSVRVMTGTTPQFLEDGGIVVMEAEHFTGSAGGMGRSWLVEAGAPGASGGAAVRASGTGSDAGDSTAGPRLDYRVWFSTPGVYHVWARMFGASDEDNAVHLGIDGSPVTYGATQGVYVPPGSWRWQSKAIGRPGGEAVTILVESPGLRTLNLWMREDGVQVDKLILARAGDYKPDGHGELESASHLGSPVEEVPYAPTSLPVVATVYGASPLVVEFDGTGSSDPEGGALTYRWDFGDGAVGEGTTIRHAFVAPGGRPKSYHTVLTVTDESGLASSVAILVSVDNSPPEVAIRSFADGAEYSSANITILDLQASVSDAEHAEAELEFAWVTNLHHNDHFHPEPADSKPVTQALLSPTPCGSHEAYSYRIQLTVTDPAGLATTVQKWLFPDCATSHRGEAWRASYFDGAERGDPSVSGWLADPDGDRRPNLLEFALGQHPQNVLGGRDRDFPEIDGQLSMGVRVRGGVQDAELAFDRPSFLPGVRTALEMSTDAMATWGPAVGADPVITPLGDHSERVVFRGLQALPDFEPAGTFFRIAARLEDGSARAHSIPFAAYQAEIPLGYSTHGVSVLRPAVLAARCDYAGDTYLGIAHDGEGSDLKALFEPGIRYFVEVASGPAVGHRFELDVAGTMASVLALDLLSPRSTASSLPEGVHGATIVIHRHWTLADAYPLAIMRGGTSPHAEDHVRFFGPAGYTSYFLLDFGEPYHYWTGVGDNTLKNRSGEVIAPGQGMSILKKRTGVTLLRAGEVRTHDFLQPLSNLYSLVAEGFPVPLSPAQRDMREAAGFVGAKSPGAADQIQVWNGNATAGAAGYTSYFLVRSGALERWVRAGDNTLVDQGDAPLFDHRHAAFLRLISGAKPTYRCPAPW